MLYTVGHSDRSIDDFLAVLDSAGVTAVVDVRKLPGSRRYPHFDADRLAESLAAHGIGFRRAEELGGRRPVSREVPDNVNGLWRNRSFHNYADHALGPAFQEGLTRLVAESDGEDVAVMCSEAVWWRCHRRLIADHALARGHAVAHLMGPGRTVPATLTPGAITAGGVVTYPAGSP